MPQGSVENPRAVSQQFGGAYKLGVLSNEIALQRDGERHPDSPHQNPIIAGWACTCSFVQRGRKSTIKMISMEINSKSPHLWNYAQIRACLAKHFANYKARHLC